jgi:hypothetical protein
LTEYDILGLSPNAVRDEIFVAYRRRVYELHSKMNTHQNAMYQFLRIRKAFEVLTDQKRKAAYDTSLRRSTTSGFNGNKLDPEWHTPIPAPIYYDPIEEWVLIYLMSWKEVETIPLSVIIKKIIITPILTALHLFLGLISGLIIPTVIAGNGPNGWRNVDVPLFNKLAGIFVPIFLIVFFFFGKHMFRRWFEHRD